MAKVTEKTTGEKAHETAVEARVLRTISLGAIGGDGKDAIRQGKSVYMGRFYGEISGIEIKEDKKSGRDFTICYGEFAAANTSGETFESDQFIFPGQVGSSILSQAKLENEKGSAYQFAIDVFAEPDAPGKKSAMGYGYVHKSLLATAARSRLHAIADQLAVKK